MRYLLTELRRTFCSFRFLVGVMGVVFSQFFSIYKVSGMQTSVYMTFICALYFIPYIMSLIFCAMPYAQSLCEDMEYGYLQQILLRKDLKAYTALRIVTIYLSAAAAMAAGTFIFVMLVHIRLPWVSVTDHFGNDLLAEIFFKRNLYIVYFIVHAFFSGILAGFLALLAAYASLFWRSKLFVLSMPFMTYCFLIYYLRHIFKNIPQLDIGVMFNPAYNVWNNKTLSIIWPVVMGAALLVILGVCTYKRLRRVYYGIL